jgi:tripeptidyl-peptidase-1
MADAERMNTEFMKAGARGISLMFASGDEGANCKGGVFVPEWPSSSPWITAVGGTTGTSTERAAGLSSGGFSNRWGMPEWQKSSVAAYLSKGSSTSGFPKSALYNASGRAYPDVSAQATNFNVVAGGGDQPGVAGTSCASPTFSGVIALLVDKRLAAGKTSLGFLNPLIYKSLGQQTMNDITSGSSSGCLFSSGWPALSGGWDAATGWGTPNFGRMLPVVLSLK